MSWCTSALMRRQLMWVNIALPHFRWDCDPVYVRKGEEMFLWSLRSSLSCTILLIAFKSYNTNEANNRVKSNGTKKKQASSLITSCIRMSVSSWGKFVFSIQMWVKAVKDFRNDKHSQARDSNTVNCGAACIIINMKNYCKIRHNKTCKAALIEDLTIYSMLRVQCTTIHFNDQINSQTTYIFLRAIYCILVHAHNVLL